MSGTHYAARELHAVLIELSFLEQSILLRNIIDHCMRHKLSTDLRLRKIVGFNSGSLLISSQNHWFKFMIAIQVPSKQQ
jgi:hypothetical protein